MECKRLILGTLGVVFLAGGVSSSLASGFGTCKAEATVLCNHGIEQSEDGSALRLWNLRFRVVGSPACRGVAKIEADQVIDAAVMLREGEELPEVRPGAQLWLQYDYIEGLGPDGFISSHRWTMGTGD